MLHGLVEVWFPRFEDREWKPVRTFARGVFPKSQKVGGCGIPPLAKNAVKSHDILYKLSWDLTQRTPKMGHPAHSLQTVSIEGCHSDAQAQRERGESPVRRLLMSCGCPILAAFTTARNLPDTQAARVGILTSSPASQAFWQTTPKMGHPADNVITFEHFFQFYLDRRCSDVVRQVLSAKRYRTPASCPGSPQKEKANLTSQTGFY